MVLVGMQPVLTQVPPNSFALDDGDFHARSRQPVRQGRPGLPGPDNDRIIACRHQSPLRFFLHFTPRRRRATLFGAARVSKRSCANNYVAMLNGDTLVPMNRRRALSLLAAMPALAQPQAKHSFSIQGDRFMLDGEPFVIRSGEMHYARIPREYWRDRMRKMRAMGLNTLCMYSFWNLHEPRPGRFDSPATWTSPHSSAPRRKRASGCSCGPVLTFAPSGSSAASPPGCWETPDIQVRTTDPRFLSAAGGYMKRLLAEVAPLQITRGGPILMLQVENEYGSFGKDKDYLNAIRQMIAGAGIDVPLYTADGSQPQMLAGGTLPDVGSVINFGGGAASASSPISPSSARMSRSCAANTGSAGSTIGARSTTPATTQSTWRRHRLDARTQHLLQPLHGPRRDDLGIHERRQLRYGQGSKGYEPTISSYDYDSPIDEAGRLAPKFALYRDVIRKHLSTGESIPEPPAPLPVIEIPRFELTETAPLVELTGKPVHSPSPLKFEDLGQSYGFVLYRTRARAASNASLEIIEPRDFAIVLQESRCLAVIDRRLGQTSASVSLSAGEPLDILVENMGRINFGPKLLEDRKGITEKVVLDGAELTGWEIFKLPCTDLRGLKFSRKPPHGPSFFRAAFHLNETGDTFIDTRGWGKGNVWINGRNLGRYWKIGPQQTLFCPGVWLKKGANQIIVLDLFDDSPVRSIATLSNPVWETLS